MSPEARRAALAAGMPFGLSQPRTTTTRKPPRRATRKPAGTPVTIGRILGA